MLETEYVTLTVLARDMRLTRGAVARYGRSHGIPLITIPSPKATGNKVQLALTPEHAIELCRQHANRQYSRSPKALPGRAYIEMTGQKINRWTFVETRGNDAKGRKLWLCRCECGNERVLSGIVVRYGAPKSCGCLRREASSISGRTLATQYPEHARQMGLANKGRHHYSQMVPQRLVICKQCNTMFLTADGTSKKQREAATFCNTECWYNYIRVHPDQSPNWHGGYQPYYGPIWDRQAKTARERDGHTCQRCGKHQTKPRLQVHHLKPLRGFESWETANELNNLITLCKSCHRRTESELDQQRRIEATETGVG